ncbi:MAG: hypothetical protein E7413_01000 [Ruminococcaceae bacterium]|nr:hypothetical protein [Oscillospiraceae bacterium]
MSQFSGKCDFYDHLSIMGYSNRDIQDKLEVYVGNRKTPLKFRTLTDLIPYYPYIIHTSVYNNALGKGVITLSKESFVDSEEREILEYYLKYLLRIYKRYKRKKELFDIDEAVKTVSLAGARNSHVVELATRVSQHGNKANIDGIHIESKDWYRRKLIEVMIQNNLNPCDYGYARLIS